MCWPALQLVVLGSCKCRRAASEKPIKGTSTQWLKGESAIVSTLLILFFQVDIIMFMQNNVKDHFIPWNVFRQTS